MPQTIIPAKCTLGECLKGHKYDIDFYQRQYVWSATTVTTLLNDLFYVFERSYEQHKDEDINSGWIDRFEWYYLSTFITNNDNGIEYIIDGQQRLTTMSLIITKLYHLNEDVQIKKYLEDCICGADLFTGNIYYIDNDKRKDVMDAIFHQQPFVKPEPSVTETTMYARYQDISKYLDSRLAGEKKLKAFTFYLLNRVILVKLDVTPDDTPMVFEVINDRGEALKPFEILKGKLIGVISKSENITYSDHWDQAMAAVRGHEDDFFDDYLKSRFVFKSNSKLESAIKNAYHRYIFSHNDIADTLRFRPEDKDRIAHIKSFIQCDLLYYTRLYGKIIQNKDEFLQYDNTINKLSGQYEIILAACTVDDPEEDAKIHAIAREYDRMYMVLRLNGAYDSNTFQELSYNLNQKIAGCPLADYRRVFDDVIKGAIRQRRGNDSEVRELLTEADFSKRGYDNMELRSLRYLLARVEKWLCENLHQGMKENVVSIATHTGAVYGYHIEHILSHNSENRSYFASDEQFDAERNILGGLLLLKGKDNISSGNELYQDKLKTYSSGLVWGHTLAPDFYHNNHAIAALNADLKARHGIEITPVPVFDADALNSRTRLLYKLVCLIWEL